MSRRAVLVITNLASFLGWIRVVTIFVSEGWTKLSDESDESSCLGVLGSALVWAIGISSVEVLNSLVGITTSNPFQVLLFSCVRLGAELLVAPLIHCGSWQHLFTALCWSVGDAIRFGCFTLHSLTPEIEAIKTIRYTVGPLLFPLGAAGEMLMVIKAASENRPLLYVAAALWPVGFFPLMKQLVQQRKKHIQKQRSTSSASKKPEIRKI